MEPRARLNLQDPAGFGMQHGIAACHLAYQGNMQNQASGTDRGMQEKCVSLSYMLKEAEEDLMSLLSYL